MGLIPTEDGIETENDDDGHTSSPAAAYHASNSQLPRIMAALCFRCLSSHISFFCAAFLSSPVSGISSSDTILPSSRPSRPPMPELVAAELSLPRAADDEAAEPPARDPNLEKVLDEVGRARPRPGEAGA